MQEAQRLLLEASGVVRLQVHRRQSATELDGKETGVTMGTVAATTLRQRVAPQPQLGGYGRVMAHPPEWTAAASDGDVASLRKQLLDGQAINQQNVCGLTALHFAATATHGDAVEFLLSQGADAALRTGERETFPNMTAREMSQVTQVSQISVDGEPLAYSKPAGKGIVELLRAAEAAQAGAGNS